MFSSSFLLLQICMMAALVGISAATAHITSSGPVSDITVYNLHYISDLAPPDAYEHNLLFAALSGLVNREVPSLYLLPLRCTITALTLYHHCTITAPYHCTNTTPSLHHHRRGGEIVYPFTRGRRPLVG